MALIEVAIGLHMPDNTAFTVLTALQGLGYAELSAVERDELLRLRLRDGVMTARECAQALTHAEVVFNPNKHRMGLATGDDGPDSDVVVSDDDDDTGALRALLGARFGIRGLESLERATAWRLWEGERCASEARLAWACRALLANPFAQRFVVRRRPRYEEVRGQDGTSHPVGLGTGL